MILILLFVFIHHYVHSVTRYHKFLVGSDDSDLYLGIRQGNQNILACGDIGLVVKLEPEVRKVLAHPAAETAVVLPDTACEDYKVHPVHDSGIGAYVFRDVIDKLLEDKLGLRVSGIGRIVQVPCIGGNA